MTKREAENDFRVECERNAGKMKPISGDMLHWILAMLGVAASLIELRKGLRADKPQERKYRLYAAASMFFLGAAWFFMAVRNIPEAFYFVWLLILISFVFLMVSLVSKPTPKE